MEDRKYLIKAERGEIKYSGERDNALDAIRQYYLLKFDLRISPLDIIVKLRKGKFTRRILIDELVETAKKEDPDCDFLGEGYWMRRAAKIKAEEEK